ncbi:MAG: hypothetical protein GY820_20105 [Gammaproteobacteria bacterium]|nr:hypothetical protein [Gammaproteobacteria bacterium]
MCRVGATYRAAVRAAFACMLFHGYFSKKVCVQGLRGCPAVRFAGGSAHRCGDISMATRMRAVVCIYNTR